MHTNKSGRRRKNVLTNEVGQTIDGKSKQLLFYECAVEMVKQVALKPRDSFSQNGANEVYEKYAKKRQSSAQVYCLIDRLRFQRKGTFSRTFRKYLPYRQIKHFFVFPSSPSVFMLCVTDEGTEKRYYETYRCRPEDVNAICDLTYKASIDPQNILRDTDALRQISILSRDDEMAYTRSLEPSYDVDYEDFPLENNQKVNKLTSYFDSLERQCYENPRQSILPNDLDERAFNQKLEPNQPDYRPPQVHDHIHDQNLSDHHRLPPAQAPKPGKYRTSSPNKRPPTPTYPRSITITIPGGRNPCGHTNQSTSSQKPVYKLQSHYANGESYPDEPRPLKAMSKTCNDKSPHKNWAPVLARLDDVVRTESRDNQSLSYSVPQQHALITSALSNETSSNRTQKWESLGAESHRKAASTSNLDWGDRVTYIQYDPQDGPKFTDDGPFYMYITRHESQQDIRPYAVRNGGRGTAAHIQPNLYI